MLILNICIICNYAKRAMRTGRPHSRYCSFFLLFGQLIVIIANFAQRNA